MEANVRDVGEVFNRGGEVHYVLPRFQRAYAWGREQWQTLWDDLLAMRDTERPGAEHFLGTMVVIREEVTGSHITVYKLVDGQQRLLTLSLILCALEEHLDDKSFLDRVRNYLTNPLEKGDRRYKLNPTEHNDDRAAWVSLLEKRELLRNSRSNIPPAFSFFQSVIRQAVEKQNIRPQELFDTLITRLFLVFIELNRQERPHQIFESLNAKGLDLSQPDLVRNYLAMRLEATRQEDAYDNYWLPIQKLLEDRHSGELTVFLRHYLVRVTRRQGRESDIYRDFRRRMDSEFADDDALLTELRRLYEHARIYDRLLRPQNETNQGLQTRFEYLNDLKRTVAYPLVLAFYDAYQSGLLSYEDFCKILDLLENLLVRHYLARMGTGLNRNLARLVPEDSREIDVDSLSKALLAQYYPADGQIRDVLRSREMHTGDAHRRWLLFLLTRVNQHLLRGQDVSLELDGAPSIEHIMPKRLGVEWERDLGPGWQQEYLTLLNNIGNLTLVTQSWNASLSNRSWGEKRKQMLEHRLPLNAYYFGHGRPGDTHLWNGKAIRARNAWLVGHMLKIWPDLRAPHLRPEHNPDRHPNAHTDYTGTTVITLTLHGQEYQVRRRAWINLAVMFTNQVAVPRPDFENLAEEFRFVLSREGKHRALSNGWQVKWLAGKAAGCQRIRPLSHRFGRILWSG